MVLQSWRQSVYNVPNTENIYILVVNFKSKLNMFSWLPLVLGIPYDAGREGGRVRLRCLWYGSVAGGGRGTGLAGRLGRTWLDRQAETWRAWLGSSRIILRPEYNNQLLQSFWIQQILSVKRIAVNDDFVDLKS